MHILFAKPKEIVFTLDAFRGEALSNLVETLGLSDEDLEGLDEFYLTVTAVETVYLEKDE
jgi:hypothetical protein